MDWFSWLSKTGLDPSLVYEYSLSFAHNELEEDDVAYFNHEFLQSMGISIAKHRLEIIKLSRKQRQRRDKPSQPMKKLLLAIKKTKQCLAKCLRNWVNLGLSSEPLDSEQRSALVLVQRQRSLSIPRRDKNLVVAKQGRLLLTNGSPMMVSSGRSRVNSFSSPMVVNHDDHDDGYWSNAVEEIKWDTLFQDLKPT